MTWSRAIRCRADATASRCVLQRAETPDPSSVRASRPATRAYKLVVPNVASCAKRGTEKLVPEAFSRTEVYGAVV